MPTCKNCAQNFTIAEDQAFYKQINVPEPKTCPECRLKRRLLERNTRKLYKRKCDFSGEEIISQYHKDHKFPVYHPKVWWSDKWSGLDYGRDYDPDKPFFEQFAELLKVTPHISLFVVWGTMENSDYVNCAAYVKNCYLSFELDYNEDCYYSNRVYQSKDLVDCFTCYKCEVCYECSDCRKCFDLKYSKDCENCSDSYFLKECKSCKNCIACINLRHKKYHIFNKPYSKEEYEKHLAEFDLEGSEGIEKLRKESQEFFLKHPHRYLQEEHNENCLGDYLYHSKNSSYCFDCDDLEDCKYCAKVSLTVKSSMDYTCWGDRAELLYQCAACGDNAYNLKFCTNCLTDNSDLEYCSQCTGCQNCFGCAGLKKGKYCILNKQYTKDKYEKLKAEIIADMKSRGEYGEFFPMELCPFGYNETIAMEYFPVSRKEALGKRFKWV